MFITMSLYLEFVTAKNKIKTEIFGKLRKHLKTYNLVINVVFKQPFLK